MRDYVFVDGPLAGQTAFLDVRPPGEAVLIEVVDFGEEPSATPTFEYVFHSEASQEHPGALRFLDKERATQPWDTSCSEDGEARGGGLRHDP